MDPNNISNTNSSKDNDNHSPSPLNPSQNSPPPLDHTTLTELYHYLTSLLNIINSARHEQSLSLAHHSDANLSICDPHYYTTLLSLLRYLPPSNLNIQPTPLDPSQQLRVYPRSRQEERFYWSERTWSKNEIYALRGSVDAARMNGEG